MIGNATAAEKDIPGEKRKTSFSATVGRSMIELDVRMGQLFQYRNLIKKSGNDTKLLPLKEIMQILMKKTVGYKSF